MNFFSNMLGSNKSKDAASTASTTQSGTQSGGDSRPDGKVSFGYSLMRGKRQSMEDFYHAQFRKDPRTGEIVGCFGIFDGHGGPNAADFVRQNLFEGLVKNPKFGTDVKTALVEAFVDTDQKYLQADSGANRDDGCTAVTAILVGQNLIVANVGDSRAVLSKGSQAFPLSEDHKPNRTDERQRIESAGGVVVWAGTWRVGGVLAVSRAFGDRLLKRYVVAMPDLQEQQLSSQDDALILASDGLWDVLANQDAAQLIKDIKDPQRAAKKLTDEAYARGSNDNISCIVVRFNF
ncbi:MAG: phosphatase 2C [Trebouxia sp. A1-2]|nr:MAG: phosphatase 2C [Trebouxia sp. A1-2]